jgi:hypothetical protein
VIGLGISVTLPDVFLEVNAREVRRKYAYKKSGVYVFYSADGEALYVGKTVDFKSRFNDHSTRSDFYNLAEKARLYFVDSEYEKDIYETHLIRELRPQYNKAKTFYSRLEYEDMLHVILEKITDAKEEIDCLLNESIYDDDLSDEDDNITLGRALHITERIAEAECSLKKLYARKGMLMSRLSV